MIHGYYHHKIVERGACIVVWMAHTMIVWERFKQPKQKTKYHTPEYNIPSNINKQTNNYIAQDHAKTKVHIWSLKSNTKLSPSLVESPLWEMCPSKKRFGYLLGHLSFQVNGMESPLIFLYTNIYIYIYILITKYMTK